MESRIEGPGSGGAHASEPGQLPPFRGGGDPWAAFGYLVSGVAVYGAIGFGLGRWLNAPFLTAVGIVVGAVLGLYLVYNRFARGMLAPPAGKQVDAPAEAASDTDPQRDGRGEPDE